jgi:hypothetical protein
MEYSRYIPRHLITPNFKKASFGRPYAHMFLEFCASLFDLYFISTMDIEECAEHLDVLGIERLIGGKPIICYQGRESCINLGYAKNSTRQIILIDLEIVYEKFPIYDPKNVLLLTDCGYKSSCNNFISGLYLKTFLGDRKESFLKSYVLPCLKLLAGSSKTLVDTLLEYYPSWSMDSLEKDWVSNIDIWQCPQLADIVHPSHFKRFTGEIKVQPQST